jgi:hypothetical protein
MRIFQHIDQRLLQLLPIKPTGLLRQRRRERE